MDKEEEIAAFMGYLKKATHSRPKFTVTGDEFQAFLEIDYRGGTMSVPLAEVLAFARAKEVEIKADMAAMVQAGRLAVYPYPVLAMNITSTPGDTSSWD